MIIYSRFVSHAALEEFPNALKDTIEHVKAHLSSVADSDDDPETNASDVVIVMHELQDGYYINGKLEAKPDAPYLKKGYDPDKEAEEGR